MIPSPVSRLLSSKSPRERFTQSSRGGGYGRCKNPYTPGITESLASFLADLLDAKWVVTTLLALYAAIVSTFQAFIKDWWLHRPRIKVTLYPSVVAGGGAHHHALSVNVVNRGYTPIKMGEAVSLEFDKLRSSWPVRAFTRRFYGGEGHSVALVTGVEFTRPFPEMVQPTDGYQAFFDRDVATEAATAFGLRGNLRLRAFVQDGTNRRHNSNWVYIDTTSSAPSDGTAA